MFRHDASMATSQPKYYEEVLCIVCKKVKFARHKGRNGTKTCSMTCSRTLNNSTWRYNNIPGEREKQIQWQKEYKYRKRNTK